MESVRALPLPVLTRMVKQIHSPFKLRRTQADIVRSSCFTILKDLRFISYHTGHLAQIFVGSMSVDSLSSGMTKESLSMQTTERHYLAGSRALDSLQRFMTSTETYFHPSNAGIWTVCLTTFLHKVCLEFSKRWKEEEQPSCLTPHVCISNLCLLGFDVTSILRFAGLHRRSNEISF